MTELSVWNPHLLHRDDHRLYLEGRGGGSHGDDSGGGWWGGDSSDSGSSWSTRAPIHLEAGMAVASMAAVRLTGE